MPRKAREKRSTGIYHVKLRGINVETIFLDREYFEIFINILKEHQNPIIAGIVKDIAKYPLSS